MKLLTLTLALTFGGASLQTLSTPARAAETAVQKTGRAAIVATYKKQGQALIKGDVTAMMADCTPDFVGYTREGQTYNRSQLATLTQQSLSGSQTGVAMKFSAYKPRLLSLTWRGKDAIVMVEETAVGSAQRAGRAVRIEQVSLSRDYWTPTSAGWKVRQSAERDSKMWLDGKRVK